MYTVQWGHIRVRCFQRESSDISGWVENNVPGAKQARQLANTGGQKLNEIRQAGTAYIEQKTESAKDIARTMDAVQRAMRSTNPRVHGVYQLLRATKVLSLDPKELAQRLMTTDGGSGARAITACIEAAEKGKPIQIVQMSGGKYSVLSLEKYKNLVNNAPGKYLSKNLIEGFAELWIGGERNLSLSGENWQNIAMYLAGNNWKINRNSIDGKTREFLGKLYEILRERYAKDIENILSPIKKKLGENEAYRNLLIENNLVDKNGRLSIDLLFRGIQPRQIREIPKLIEIKIGRLVSSSKKLLSLGNELMLQNNIDDTSMRGFLRREIIIKIDGKSTNVSHINISDLNPKQIEQVIPLFAREIGKFQILLQSEKNPENQKILRAHVSNLQRTLTALTLKYEGYKNAGTASELKVTQRQVERVLDRTPNASKESLQRTLESDRAQKVRNAAHETGIARSHIEQFGEDISLIEAQKRYSELLQREKNGETLSEKEQAEKRRYIAFLDANTSLAREYQKMEARLGQEEAQKIFTEVNKTVSENAGEIYNFQGLTKIATMDNEQVTKDMKNLAWIKPGVENKIALGDDTNLWESIYAKNNGGEKSLYAAYIQNGGSGYYVILDKNNKPLSTKPLSIEQVEGYRDNIITLQGIGVSELVPHIEFINTEIGKRNFYTVNSLDGDFSYEEGYRVLRGLAEVVLSDEEMPKSPNEIIKLLQRKARESGRPTLGEFMKYQMEVLGIIRDDGSFNEVRFSSLLNAQKK